jgi:ribosomal protein S12 methylthiotransferase accessory factor
MRLQTSLRERDAAQTWALASPLMPCLGISRVTDITALDRLGLPVHASVRPRGQLLSVHAGKGLRAVESRTGALMEAVEFALAEADSLREPDARATLADLQAAWPGRLAPIRFAPRVDATLAATEVWPAVACEWLEWGEATLQGVRLPDELVRLPGSRRQGPSAFPWSTNGLASGNTVDEATLHGLFELLERDSLALNHARDASRLLDELPEPFAAMRGQWARDGVELIVREIPNEFGLACFSALLHEEASVDVNLSRGSGLHLDRSIALARAISEAAQARLSTLHGGRDDIVNFYAKYALGVSASRLAGEARLLERWRDRSRTVEFEAVPHSPITEVTTALSELRARMARAGLSVIVRHRLPWPDAIRGRVPLQVVKRAVPGCEVLEARNRRVGARLLARLLAHG